MSVSELGVQYQTDSRSCAQRIATAAGNDAMRGLTGCSDAPAAAVANRSNVERSKWNGAWFATRSRAVRPNVSAAQSVNTRQLRCDSITPLGSPVDPLV